MTCKKQAAFSAQSYSPVCRRFIHRIIARKKKTEPKNMKSFLIESVPFPYVKNFLVIIRFSCKIVSIQHRVVR
jgi:hypothetical protein